MPFVPGQSGNPAGRPIGSRNKKTLLMEALLEGEGEGLTHRVIEKALTGDPTAMRLCVERLLPSGRERPVPFELPRIENAKDVREAINEVTAAAGAGTLNIREALDFLRRIEKIAQILAAAGASERQVEKVPAKSLFVG